MTIELPAVAPEGTAAVVEPVDYPTERLLAAIDVDIGDAVLVEPAVVTFELDPDELVDPNMVLPVRWNEPVQQWVTLEASTVIDQQPGILSFQTDRFSRVGALLISLPTPSISQIAQTGQELLGTRAAGPDCGDPYQPPWLSSFSANPNPGEAIRVCLDPDDNDDDIVTLRIVNNRAYGQTLHSSHDFAWTWGGDGYTGALGALVDSVYRPIIDSPRTFYLPPLHEVAVGIARPDGLDAFVELTAQVDYSTLLAFLLMKLVEHSSIPLVSPVLSFLSTVLACTTADGLFQKNDSLQETLAAILSVAVACWAEAGSFGSLTRGFLESAVDSGDLSHSSLRLLTRTSWIAQAWQVLKLGTSLTDLGAELLYLEGDPVVSLLRRASASTETAAVLSHGAVVAVPIDTLWPDAEGRIRDALGEPDQITDWAPGCSGDWRYLRYDNLEVAFLASELGDDPVLHSGRIESSGTFAASFGLEYLSNRQRWESIDGFTVSETEFEVPVWWIETSQADRFEQPTLWGALGSYPGGPEVGDGQIRFIEAGYFNPWGC